MKLHPVVTGTLSELRFATSCLVRGAVVSFPFGGAVSPYDVVVGVGSQLYRVQVRLVSGVTKQRATFMWCRRNRKPYTKDEIDLFAVDCQSRWLILTQEELAEGAPPRGQFRTVPGDDARFDAWDRFGLPRDPINPIADVEHSPQVEDSSLRTEVRAFLDVLDHTNLHGGHRGSDKSLGFSMRASARRRLDAALGRPDKKSR